MVYAKPIPRFPDFVYRGAEIVAGPCSAITGPVEEFTALGYDEAKAGGTFLKIGVGVLRKPDDAPYSGYRLYEIVDGGKWSIKKSEDAIEFTQELHDSVFRIWIRLSEKDKPGRRQAGDVDRA